MTHYLSIASNLSFKFSMPSLDMSLIYHSYKVYIIDLPSKKVRFRWILFKPSNAIIEGLLL